MPIRTMTSSARPAALSSTARNGAVNISLSAVKAASNMPRIGRNAAGLIQPGRLKLCRGRQRLFARLRREWRRGNLAGVGGVSPTHGLIVEATDDSRLHHLEIR